MKDNSSLELGQIVRLILMQSKLVIAIILVITSLSILYYSTATKTYKISTLLQVYSPSQISSASALPMDLLSGSSNSSALSNLVPLYDSRSNVIDIINKLNLNLSFNELSDDEFIKFDKFYVAGLVKDQIAKFYLRKNNDLFELYDSKMNLIDKIAKNTDYNFDTLEINISDIKLKPEKLIEISYKRVEDSVSRVQQSIKVGILNSNRFNLLSQNGLMEISLISDDVEQAKEIIDLANSIFINKNIEVESKKARRAIEFLDERLLSLDEVLAKNKSKLKSFQEQNISLNVDLEIKSIIDKLSEVEKSIAEIDLEFAKASNIFTQSNPLYQNLTNQKETLINQRSAIQNRIKMLPIAQQEYIDLFRDVEISQELYSELVNRKLGFSILEASTLGNIIIIDSAYVDGKVSPSLSIVLLMFFFSIILSITVAIVRGLNFLPISNPAELDDNDIQNPIVGVMPFFDDQGILNSSDTKDLKFSQSIESLIVNINTIKTTKGINNANASTILITSPTASNGKSFISSSIARKFSDMGSKVLLIDNDQKKGKLHKIYKTKTISQNDFYSFHENMEKYKQSENLYLLPRISKLTSSFHFLYTELYQNYIEGLKEHFDIIVFDTPPLLSVSDTSILMSISDMNFSIIRHDYSKINEVKQFMKIAEQTGITIDGIIYNSYQKPNSYYGYYGLYGNYNYEYYANKYLYESYSYDDKE